MNAPLPVRGWIDPDEDIREEEMSRAARVLAGFNGTLAALTDEQRREIAAVAAQTSENSGRR